VGWIVLGVILIAGGVLIGIAALGIAFGLGEMGAVVFMAVIALALLIAGIACTTAGSRQPKQSP